MSLFLEDPQKRIDRIDQMLRAGLKNKVIPLDRWRSMKEDRAHLVLLKQRSRNEKD